MKPTIRARRYRPLMREIDLAVLLAKSTRISSTNYPSIILQQTAVIFYDAERVNETSGRNATARFVIQERAIKSIKSFIRTGIYVHCAWTSAVKSNHYAQQRLACNFYFKINQCELTQTPSVVTRLKRRGEGGGEREREEFTERVKEGQ